MHIKLTVRWTFQTNNYRCICFITKIIIGLVVSQFMHLLGYSLIVCPTGARNQISHMPLTTHDASFVYNITINKRGTMGSKGHVGNLITSACGMPIYIIL